MYNAMNYLYFCKQLNKNNYLAQLNKLILDIILNKLMVWLPNKPNLF